MYWINLLRNIAKVGIIISIMSNIVIYYSFMTELKNSNSSEKTIEETLLLKKSKFMFGSSILIVVFSLIELIFR